MKSSFSFFSSPCCLFTLTHAVEVYVDTYTGKTSSLSSLHILQHTHSHQTIQYMATAATTGKARCVACGKEKIAYKCEGCSQYFCVNHLAEHHQLLGKQLDEVENQRNLFRQTLTEQKNNPQKHSLIKQIDQWERESIRKIRETAEEAKALLITHTTGHINNIEVELTKLTEQLKQSQQENDVNEIILNEFKQKLA